MKTTFWLGIIGIVFSSYSGWSQHRFWIGEEPVFRSKEDSTAYQALDHALGLAMKDRSMKVDSLLTERNRMAQELIVGYRKTYRATPPSDHPDSASFLSLGQLKSKNDFSGVTRVALTGAQLKTLPAELIRCTNLERLELVNTKIRSLKKLKKLTHLKSLYVLNNTPGRPLKLGKQKSLKWIGFRSEDAHSMPRSFKGWVALERVDLSNCGLTQFPKGLQQSRNLKEIQLGNNNLTLNNDPLPVHPFVERLDLQRNKIASLPSSIGNFPSLKRLTLTYNQISEVTPAISKLAKLEQLSFYRNQLQTFPSALYELKNLKELDLYYNQIERVDDRISEMQSLNILYLANNRLIAVPDAIGDLAHLTELYLHNNRLTVLPDRLGNLANLRVLRVNDNHLAELPASLAHLTLMENLDLSRNSIQQLPAGMFELLSLKILVLEENPWTREEEDHLQAWAERLRLLNATVHFNPSVPKGGF